VALALESAVVVGGLCAFLSGTALTRARKLALAALVLLTLVFTIVGMTVAPPPPSATAMAGSSFATLVVVCALSFWLGRLPRAR